MISLKKIITNLLKKFNQNQKIEDIIKLNFGQIKLQLFKQNYKNSSPINSYEFKFCGYIIFQKGKYIRNYFGVP